MKSVLLIGYGEVGQGVYSYYSQFHTIDILDPKYKKQAKVNHYDILLVTIPYSDDFVQIVNDYVNKFNPKCTIIFSSVPIGTTSTIRTAVHSPVEGRHPNLARSIGTFKRFIGGLNNLAIEFFEQANQSPSILAKSEHTEFLKLQSTSNYGLMIEYARYVNEVCQSIGMNYDFVKLFNEEYNKLYQFMDLPNIKRYILDPPKGNTGGHCIVPNSKLLDAQFPSVFLKEIYSNKED